MHVNLYEYRKYGIKFQGGEFLKKCYFQVITYKSTHRNKTSSPFRSTIACFPYGSGLIPGDSAHWRQDIPVPPLMPSDLIHCDIIDVKYYVVVSYNQQNSF